MLAPLTELIRDVPLKWETKHQESFDAIKSIIAKETMLYHLDSTKPFLFLPDASDNKLGVHVTTLKNPLSNADWANTESLLELDRQLVLFHS